MSSQGEYYDVQKFGDEWVAMYDPEQQLMGKSFKTEAEARAYVEADMNPTDTNQANEVKLEAELENLIRNNIHTFADEYLELDECVAALTAYTNKQIEEVLDRLEAQFVEEVVVIFGKTEFKKQVPLSAIEAERNKLKEAK